ncbi:hypothetical protein CTAYLR_003805 [Chrysophaeum taylorii]|uniref:Uncharacterized protein n=1 Tax=Chrysophaeum taylorii TaxID=2483200 RepID=A0AAD7UFK6_9STRA|nr:hypothetical protein CTAYLR_003805 [Chrysophaeum taylorii]
MIRGVRWLSAAADFAALRFGCNAAEASTFEARLHGRWVPVPEVASRVCDSLQRRLALSEAEIKKLVLAKPQVLGYSYESKIAPSLAALQNRLGLSESELKRVILAMPSVLSYSYEANVEAKLAFLQHELELSDEQLREKVVAFPMLLGYSLERRYRPRLRLCRKAGKPLRWVLDRASLTDDKFDRLVSGGGSS